MSKLSRLLVCAWLSLFAVPAMAQTSWTTPGGSTVNGAVGMCLSASNKAVPCSDPTALASPVSGSFSASLSTLANSPLVGGMTTSAMTGIASTQVVAAVATKRLYITRVKCNNSSTTVGTLVQIQDGSGGAVLDTLLAATSSGEQGTGSTPLFWTTAGNGLFAQDVTTGASVICTASGYSG